MGRSGEKGGVLDIKLWTARITSAWTQFFVPDGPHVYRPTYPTPHLKASPAGTVRITTVQRRPSSGVILGSILSRQRTSR